MSALPRRFSFALVATLTAASVTLTGCFSDAPADSDAGIVTVGMEFQPVAGLSPYSEDATINTRLNIAETLIRTDENGIPAPLLATSWTESDDNTKVEFHLREGVHFHDGTELDAQSVVNSLQHALDAATRPKGLGKKDMRVEAIGEHTVAVTTSEPDPILLQRFTDPGTVILAPGAFSGTDPNPVGFGTGSYSASDVQEQSVTLKAFDDYWGIAPQVAELNVTFISDSTARINAFRSGDIDIIKGVPIASIGELEKDSYVDVETVALPRVSLLYFNTTSSLFSDPELRKATAAAIDPSVIVDSVYEGYAAYPDGSLFGRELDWAKNTPHPDFGDPTPDVGKGKKLTLATWNDRAELPESAEILADQLRKVGFEVTLKVSDYASLEPELQAGAFDLVLGSRNFMLGAADPATILSSDFSCEGSYNLAHYCDPGFDETVALVLGLGDTAERNQAAAQASAKLVDDAVVVPIIVDQAHLATRGYNGLTLDPREIFLLGSHLEAK